MDVVNYQTDPYACVTTPVVGGMDTPPEGLDWSVSSAGSSILRLPLPLSRWRDASPSLALLYASDAGNGVFGLGFHVPVPSIRRDIADGVPRFDDSDGYVGPDGERLIATDSRTVDQVGGIALPHTWKAVRYRPQVDSRSDRIEHSQFPIIAGIDRQRRDPDVADGPCPNTSTFITLVILQLCMDGTGRFMRSTT